MAAHAAKPLLPDARVRQEAQQTLSAWAEKNHHGRSWRTGCRTRWFVMHGFHVRYYADEKAARQAATIRTTSACHGHAYCLPWVAAVHRGHPLAFA